MLTFEKIREFERVERNSKKLQKLPDDIVDLLGDYIQKKEKNVTTSSDILELENAKNTIKRFFELREQKMLMSALDTVKTGLPPENLTKEEEDAFYRVVDSVKTFREKFFEQLRKQKVEEKHEQPETREKEQTSVYRVKKSLPEFIGPDMRTYKLSENDLITLPKELEDLLLKEGVIEKA